MCEWVVFPVPCNLIITHVKQVYSVDDWTVRNVLSKSIKSKGYISTSVLVKHGCGGCTELVHRSGCESHCSAGIGHWVGNCSSLLGDCIVSMFGCESQDQILRCIAGDIAPKVERRGTFSNIDWLRTTSVCQCYRQGTTVCVSNSSVSWRNDTVRIPSNA